MHLKVKCWEAHSVTAEWQHPICRLNRRLDSQSCARASLQVCVVIQASCYPVVQPGDRPQAALLWLTRDCRGVSSQHEASMQQEQASTGAEAWKHSRPLNWAYFLPAKYFLDFPSRFCEVFLPSHFSGKSSNRWLLIKNRLVQSKWNIPSFHLRACYHKTSMKSDSDAICHTVITGYYSQILVLISFFSEYLRNKFTNVCESQLAEE